MSSLALLALATPIFGLSLHLDGGMATGPSVGFGTSPAMVAAVAPLQDDEGDPGAAPAAGPVEPSIGEQLGRRAELAKIHRALGIATWASMTATVALGYIQYYNQYGFFSSRENTPCVEGRAVFGQGACVNQPLPHLLSSVLTTGLYATTLGFSFAMPDPLNADEGDSDYARNIRRHRRLRWVHLAGMVAQLALGAVISNSEAFGLDRANDYGTLQALSTVHAALGLVTYGTLTWAGLIFL